MESNSGRFGYAIVKAKARTRMPANARPMSIVKIEMIALSAKGLTLGVACSVSLVFVVFVRDIESEKQ